MDCCSNVERELEKVRTNFSSFKEEFSTRVDKLLEEGEILQNTLGESGEQWNPDNELILNNYIRKIRDAIGHLSSEHRDFHGIVSKVGKAIDKNFTSDFSVAGDKDIFADEENKNLLNQVICEHFLRQGKLDIADELISEANLNIDETQREPFAEINYILESLGRKDLDPAIKWAQKNKTRLRSIQSPLEFKLYKLRFITLLEHKSDNQFVAIQYARENFRDLAQHHQKDIQVLMGSLLFQLCDREEFGYPYDYLHDNSHWIEVCEVFTRDACALLGLAAESPLTVCVHAGCTALPALLNIRQVMQQRQVTGVWNIRDELPIEIDVGNSCRFHSVFACPILRQQSSDVNPPMRLVCGHVISRDALTKLSNGHKLKCPYCPVEQNPADARLLHF